MMAKQLESSPMDKHKSIHGETDQANYLLEAKEQNSPYLKKKKPLGESSATNTFEDAEMQ